ncbi:DUF4337 domain-containing protein [Sphaerotilus sp.]|uniref:DUF4337 domain-containing protein n=1 Tax=Sphaerotilus sp. TaxID=2093942 RepID=UPI0034E2F15A
MNEVVAWMLWYNRARCSSKQCASGLIRQGTLCMDMDPIELIDSTTDPADGPQQRASKARLNTCVAITVSVLATFMGLCKVKDDNIVQAMQQAQADKLDHWNYYQARNLREDLAQATLTQLRLAAEGQTPEQVSRYRPAIDRYEDIARTQATKKEEVKAQAEQDQTTYDALNYRDDQFDLSDALLAVAISILAVTALTGQWWMYGLALVPTGFGVLMGLAGLCGWMIHPDRLAALLS